MARKKIIKTPQATDVIADIEAGLNVERNVISDTYEAIKKAGVFTVDHHDTLVKNGLNLLISIAGFNGLSISHAKSKLVNGEIAFADVESTLTSLGGDVFVAMDSLAGKVDVTL